MITFALRKHVWRDGYVVDVFNKGKFVACIYQDAREPNAVRIVSSHVVDINLRNGDKDSLPMSIDYSLTMEGEGGPWPRRT